MQGTTRRSIGRDVERAQHRTTTLGTDLRHSVENAAGVNQVVGKQHRERVLVGIQHRLDKTDGMTQAERGFLDDRLHRYEARCSTHTLEQMVLSTRGELALEHQVLDEVTDHLLCSLTREHRVGKTFRDEERPAERGRP